MDPVPCLSYLLTSTNHQGPSRTFNDRNAKRRIIGYGPGHSPESSVSYLKHLNFHLAIVLARLGPVPCNILIQSRNWLMRFCVVARKCNNHPIKSVAVLSPPIQ